MRSLGFEFGVATASVSPLDELKIQGHIKLIQYRLFADNTNSKQTVSDVININIEENLIETLRN